MKDLLKEYCKSKNIKLKYTKNKSAVLSIDNEKSIPTIRIHKMFKSTSEDTINKIIQYYELYQKNYSIIKFIQNYVDEFYKNSHEFKYGADNLFLNTSTKSTIQINHTRPAKSPESSMNGLKTSDISSQKSAADNEKNADITDNIGDVIVHNEKAFKDLKVVDFVLTRNNNIIFTFKPQKRSAIHGIVKLSDGNNANNALVKLYSKQAKSDELIPVTFTFTDENGEFMFGVPSGEYVLKIFYYDYKE